MKKYVFLSIMLVLAILIASCGGPVAATPSPTPTPLPCPDGQAPMGPNGECIEMPLPGTVVTAKPTPVCAFPSGEWVPLGPFTFVKDADGNIAVLVTVNPDGRARIDRPNQASEFVEPNNWVLVPEGIIKLLWVCEGQLWGERSSIPTPEPGGIQGFDPSGSVVFWDSRLFSTP
jgi:hypothetical protein